MVFVWELLHVGPGRASDEFLTESDGHSSGVRNSSEALRMVFVWELLHVGPGRASDVFLTESDGHSSGVRNSSEALRMVVTGGCNFASSNLCIELY